MNKLITTIYLAIQSLVDIPPEDPMASPIVYRGWLKYFTFMPEESTTYAIIYKMIVLNMIINYIERNLKNLNIKAVNFEQYYEIYAMLPNETAHRRRQGIDNITTEKLVWKGQVSLVKIDRNVKNSKDVSQGRTPLVKRSTLHQTFMRIQCSTAPSTTAHAPLRTSQEPSCIIDASQLLCGSRSRQQTTLMKFGDDTKCEACDYFLQKFTISD